ncbi:mechanosensitive ion channel family protein [Facilibium subflavum]|uniref:mechanosensitive ion channel family protein n=1 Tax=Facilibium subflavum TaxID=2219058 RepID=UPI0013C3707D|nr:mechanosensitive ion channel family protein [Facilibium subflavum]
MNDELLQQYLSPWLIPIVHVLIVLISVIVVNIIIRIALAIFAKKLSKKSNILRLFYQSINKPLRIITWIIGLWIIVTQTVNWEGDSVQTVLDISYMVIKVLVILCIVWALFSFAKNVKNYFIEKNTRTDGGYNDFSMIETSYKASQGVILVLAFFTILSALNIPLIALAGMTTVIAGFLAISQQELIKNLFGGLVIYIDRPFSVGDWIYTTSGDIQGTVEKISFRLTQICGFDQRPIYVPNSTFLNASIVNASRMKNRRILQYVGIRYQDFEKLPAILEDIRNMLKNHKAIDQSRTTLVCIVNGSTNMGSSTEGVFGAYSINFMIYTFTKTTNWVRFQATQDAIMIEVGKIIASHGAQIAFPTTTIDMPEDAIEILSGKQALQSN